MRITVIKNPTLNLWYAMMMIRSRWNTYSRTRKRDMRLFIYNLIINNAISLNHKKQDNEKNYWFYKS
jgi:hypothetical protein